MWTTDEQEILTLNVSGKVYKYDPMPMQRRYRAAMRRVGDKAFSEGLKQMLSGTETPEVAALVMPCIKETLGWVAFDEDNEKGHTETAMIVAFTQFIEWLIESKKKEETLPSSSVLDAPSTSEIAPTPSIAVLSSAETSSNPEGLGLLQSAQA